MVDYNYLAAVLIAVLAIFAIVMSKQWFMSGFRIWIGNLRFKGNAGALFLRTVGNDFAPPLVVDLRTDKYEDKKRTVFYNRDMFSTGRFMGVPYCMMDSEDGKTSLGIYKQQTDKDGKPLSVALTINEESIIQPITKPLKESVSLSSELVKSSINAIALTQAVRDFLEKNKVLLYVCMAAAIAGAAGAYFGYSNNGLIQSVCSQGINQLSGQITALQLNLTGVA